VIIARTTCGFVPMMKFKLKWQGNQETINEPH